MIGFRAPTKYVQGREVLNAAATFFEQLHIEGATIIGGKTAINSVESQVCQGLEAINAPYHILSGVSHSTESQVSALCNEVQDQSVDTIIGVGGGSAIDAAKAVATRENTTFISIPTIASTDAPASSIAVLYDPDGKTSGVEIRSAPPELVIADTTVLLEAPARYLRYGLGDALATRFEAAACAAGNGTTIHGESPSDTGRSIARRCHGIIVKYGAEAIESNELGAASTAFEEVIEAIFLQSALGFENGGLAAAHAMEVGFRLAGVTDPPHGALVGFCTLAQLHLEDAPAYDSVANLLQTLGLDNTLDDFGVTPSQVPTIAEVTAEGSTSINNEPVSVTAADIEQSIRSASDSLAT